MLRAVFLTLVFVLSVNVTHASHVGSDSSLDSLLSRIDALITELTTIKTEVATLQSEHSVTPTPSVQGAATQKTLTMSLAYGETNEDIARIQRLLATDPEIYEYGVDSGFFGPKTEAAIVLLQTRFDLDPVGAIGPATTALLERFFAAYPDENYPAGVLQQLPKVASASTSVAPTPAPTTPTPSTVNPLRYLRVEVTRGEGEVIGELINGNDVEFVADGYTESELIKDIARRLGIKDSFVEAVIRFDEEEDDNDDDRDYDEDDAEDALDDADDAIDDADDEIDEADEDGEDVDWAKDLLEEAEDALDDAEDAFDDEDWDEAVEKAEEAEELAEEAEDAIGEDENDNKKGDSDDIDSIEVDVNEDESDVTVEYEDGDEYEFTVEEDKIDEIIEEVADELDMDEDDVEDIIEFDFGSVDEIEVIVYDDEASVKVYYGSGVIRRFTVDENDEDDIIEAIADEIDEDEDDVEDWTDFDFE